MTTPEADVTVHSCRANEIDPKLLAQCEAMWRREWPPYPDHRPDPDAEWNLFSYTLLIGPENRVAGACNFIDRTVSVAGEPYRVAGLGGVIIDPELRGQRLGSRLVPAANAWVGTQGFGWSLLFCSPERRSFYGRFGGRELTGEVSVTNFGERQKVDAVTMVIPLNEKATAQLPIWLDAPVHVGVGQW